VSFSPLHVINVYNAGNSKTGKVKIIKVRLRNLIRIAFLILVISIGPVASASIIPDTPRVSCCPDLRAEQLIRRLDDIRDTNKTLAKYEKKGLRKEVKEIRKELKSTGGGSHFSLGVAIMIMFLLNVFLA
jgi:hypothetical protein